MRHLAALFLALAAFPAGAAPKVLTDIPPVHALVAQVMDGAGQPTLLLRPGESAHGLNLRPSQAAEAQAADLVFWIGPALSPALERPLSTLAAKAHIIALIDAPGTGLIDSAAEPHAHEPGQQETDAEDGHDHGPIDPHVWLDPQNARHWLPLIASALAEQDPENAALYQANAAQAATRLADLQAQIAATLAPHRDARYLTTHRAFAYFEARFHLAPAQALSDTDGGRPGPRAFEAIRHAAQGGVTCLIAEPETSAATLAALTEGTGLTPVTIDPLGRALPPGPDLYTELLQAIAMAYTTCLK